MSKFEISTYSTGVLGACLSAVLVLSSCGAYGQDSPATPKAVPYYKERPIFQPYPQPTDKEAWSIQNFGPVGIGIDLVRPGFTMMISTLEKGSPAEQTGKLKKGQIIESINGIVLKDRDPREILGDIITDAEAQDGKVSLTIKDVGDVMVTIPVMGAYSPTWPLNCPKSDKIVRNLADLLAKDEKPRWGSVLFLLSTGEEKDLSVVRKWMAGIQTIGAQQWEKGYLGSGLCEYYLRTGDQSVLPIIKKMTDELKETMYNGGWSGRGLPAAFTYSTGSGQMHAAGVHCVTFLLMARLCGVEVDEYTLQRSLKAFYRFAGHGNVAYGDGLPEGGFRDNGKTGGLALAMAAAALLTPEGEDSVYAKARDNSAMKSFYATSWFHVAHTGGGIGEIWHHKAISLMHEKRPIPYRSYLDTRRWMMELSRRHDGSIGIAGVQDRYDRSASEDHRAWGTYVALTYTLPRKTLQLYGAPRSKYCVSYSLPARPWGNAADDIFQSPEPAAHPSISMRDLMNENVPQDASLPIFERIGKPTVSDEELLKYVYHPEYGLRDAAMRCVVIHGRYHLVPGLLKSSDPRIRHAGVLAIAGMFKGSPMPTDKVTPEMYELLGKIIEDPNESWWVVQEATQALNRGGPALVSKHRDRLLALLEVDSWWVQMAAANTLTTIATQPAHYKAVLPAVVKMLANATTLQALRPSNSLVEQMKAAPPEVKAFADPLLKSAYASVPQELVAPGGAIISGGAKAVRGKLSDVMSQLPGGQTFLRTMPKATKASATSGKDADQYIYSGTFTPNAKVQGKWLWIGDVPGGAETVTQKFIDGKLKEIEKAKTQKKFKPSYLTLQNNGVINPRDPSKFWTDDMLVDTATGDACQMTILMIGGKAYLLVEKTGFNQGNAATGYALYSKAN